MTSDNELARALFGTNASARSVEVYTVLGTALEDSSGGSVTVVPNGTAGGVDASFEVKTQGGVNVGDTVLVTVENGAPINAVSAGSVDIVRTLAEQSQGAYTDDSTYYLLSSTTPATPTDGTWEAAGWSTTEPIIGQGDTRTLYASRRVELVDGTVTWSAPTEVMSKATLEVMRNAIISTVSSTYSTKAETAEVAQDASDAALANANSIESLKTSTSTQIEQSARDVTATIRSEITETNTTLDGIVERVSTIEKSVRIDDSGVTIAASDSPITANLDNTGLTFSAGDTPVLTLNAETSTAEAERVSIGNYQWREMGEDAIALVWIGA